MLTQYIEKLHIYVLNSKKRFWSSHNNATAAKLDVATIPNLIIWLLLLTKRKEDTVTLALPVPAHRVPGTSSPRALAGVVLARAPAPLHKDHLVVLARRFFAYAHS